MTFLRRVPASPWFLLPVFGLLLPGSGRAAGADAPAEVTVELNPFEVTADSDTSYGATNSRSITNFNASLDRLPVSADIFDQAFMNDVADNSVEDIIRTYSAGAGFSALDAGASAANNQPGDRVGLAFMQLRGGMAPTIQRGSLLPVGTFGNPGGTSIGRTDNFDVERVEIIRGPESLLYNGGGPGGVINLMPKEARLDAPAFGSLLFRIDEYGSKYAQLNYGASEGDLAVRVALVDGSDDSRRINIGDELKGGYVQFAYALGRTTLRLSLDQTVDWRVDSAYSTVTSAGTDPLNGLSLGYLLATHQAGSVANGTLNWSNVNSLEGNWLADKVVSEYAMLSADTRWTSWLSTQVAVGDTNFIDDAIQNAGGQALYSPSATANPAPGNWTFALLNSPPEFPAGDVVRPYHTKALRFAAVISNDLLQNSAKSQTSFGTDVLSTRGSIMPYGYYQADGNFNIVSNGPSTNSNAGRTSLPTQYWTVNNGIVAYPLPFTPGAPRFTLNGVNYVRAQADPISSAAITPADPEGGSVTTSPADMERIYGLNEGAYAINYSQWLSGKLDTLAGIRYSKIYTNTELANLSLIPDEIQKGGVYSFNAGADYHLLPWMSPYAQVSDSDLLPPVLSTDPDGNVLPKAHTLGEEVGLKIDSKDWNLSGSLSAFHYSAVNQEFRIQSTLQTDINPAGRNGRYGSSGAGFAADTQSQGLEATLTAAPTPNWRVRFSAAFTDGTIESTRTYSQLYNDQFYENGQGQVTYADGTPVYVNSASFSSASPTVASSAPNAAPLTVAMMSTPSSIYYANPAQTTGAINSGSNVAKVLAVVDPVHGKILTGALGLPMSQFQLIQSSIPGLVIPGSINVATKGDATTGYPEYTFNCTNLYTFSEGILKGLRLGGTVSAGWKDRQEYYYPQGVAASGPNAPRTLFSLPTLTRVDAILGYQHKLGRIAWLTQLNVNNLFNRYDVLLYPNELTGFTSPVGVGANFDQQPRSYTWSNTLSF